MNNEKHGKKLSITTDAKPEGLMQHLTRYLEPGDGGMVQRYPTDAKPKCETCVYCKGTGWMVVYGDWDDLEQVKCPKCNGTGRTTRREEKR